MSYFECNKIIEDGQIRTVTTTAIFSVLNTAKVSPTKPSLLTMGIIKIAGEICGGLLVKDWAVYKKNQRVSVCLADCHKMQQQNRFFIAI